MLAPHECRNTSADVSAPLGMIVKLTPQERREISALAFCDPETVRRAYAGKTIKPSTWERLRRAAEALDLPPPPPYRDARGLS